MAKITSQAKPKPPAKKMVKVTYTVTSEVPIDTFVTYNDDPVTYNQTELIPTTPEQALEYLIKDVEDNGYGDPYSWLQEIGAVGYATDQWSIEIVDVEPPKPCKTPEKPKATPVKKAVKKATVAK